MKFLIIDDEHELYRRMFADLFKATSYHIEEIPRMIIPEALEKIYKFHFSDRVNRHVWIPFKRIWKNCYCLHKYDFDSNEKYIVKLLPEVGFQNAVEKSTKISLWKRVIRKMKKILKNVGGIKT